jgi:hypothetical protein
VIPISKTLALKMSLAEAKGQIPEGTAIPLTFASIAEVGVRAACEGYYGPKAVGDAITNAKAEQMALDASDEIIADIRPLTRMLQATHTTSDFPLALSNLRQRRIYESYAGQDSQWRDYATVITVPDFKPIRSLRLAGLPELRLRPEATDVTYATFGEAEGGYRIANYEKAVKYTWEMNLADDVGQFTRQLEALGRGAARTEALVVFQAIADGVARTALTAGIGAPTIDRLAEMERRLAEKTLTDAEQGTSIEYGFVMTDVIHGTRQRQYINAVLNQQFRDFQGGNPNPMNGAFNAHLEPLWTRVLANDLIGYDRGVEWLEVAFLEGFQGGPRTYVKLPDERDFPDEGSFADHTLHVKVGHNLGSKVIAPEAVIRTESA